MPRVLALLLALLAAPAAAGPGEAVQARLIEGWREAGGVHVAAVEIALAPGWHTYWRAPGAGGIPPRFNWSGSANLADVALEWPHPEVFDSFGIRTIGYPGGLVLPVLLTPARPGEAIELRLTLSFGVCKDICIPAEAALAATLDADTRRADAAGPGRAAIEAALARRARRPAEAGVVAARCRLVPNGRGHDVTATVELAAAPGREQVAVIEAASPGVWVGEASASTVGRRVTAEAAMEHALPGGLLLDRGDLRLTLIDDARVVDIEGCAAR